MKPFIVSFSLSCMFMLALASCTNFSIEERKANLEKESLQSLLLEKGTTPITANEAINVALLYNIQNKIETKGELEKNVSDVYTVYREEGEPSMYAVNYQNNKGFIVVSASRKYYPIVAMVEQGHFDDSFIYCPLGGWIDEQNEQIAMAERDEVEEEIANSIRMMWSAYEKKGVAKWIETKSEAEAFALRQSSVAAWEQQGYTCYALMDQPSAMPSSVYSSWCQLAQGLANPDYNYMLYSVILEKYVESTSTIGPLIGSTWARENGYNVSYTDGNGNLRPWCSRTVAVGQIMRFHQRPYYPNNLNWNNMPLTSPTTTTSDFLYWLTGEFGPTYQASGWDPTDAVAEYTLHNNLGYSTLMSVYSRNSVISDISSNMPVYLSGNRTVNGVTVDMAWVCEGYKRVIGHYEYELKVLSMDEPLTYENGGTYVGTTYSDTNYLYHNLGLGGNLNGWYISDTFAAGSNTMAASNMIYCISH